MVKRTIVWRDAFKDGNHAWLCTLIDGHPKGRGEALCNHSTLADVSYHKTGPMKCQDCINIIVKVLSGIPIKELTSES